MHCRIHINYMSSRKRLVAVLALKYLVCFDIILSLLDKVHQILVAPCWLAKSWKVEITRLWHLAFHRELPSEAGKVLHSRPELPLERSNLLATGVPPNVGVTIESGIIYQKPLCLQILQQQGSSFPTVYSTRGRLTLWSMCECYHCPQLVRTTLLFHFTSPVVA